MDHPSRTDKYGNRIVLADLRESTPTAGAIYFWALASPMLIFVAWTWLDLLTHFSPIPWYWLDLAIGMFLFVVLLVLPLGVFAHWLVTSAPRLCQHAGWDFQPLETVSPSEQYVVRYEYRKRHRAEGGWRRWWVRTAQGWVYLEIAAILTGAILMLPLFHSAVEFGFGQ